MFLGSLEWKDRLRYWGKKVEKASRFEREVEPPLKEFKPANQNLKILKSYPEVLEETYWESWVRNEYKEEKGSMINDLKVKEVVDRLEVIEKSKVDNICTMLREGANIGVEGEGRWLSWGRNNSTVYQFGERVEDSLQTAVKYGIM